MLSLNVQQTKLSYLGKIHRLFSGSQFSSDSADGVLFKMSASRYSRLHGVKLQHVPISQESKWALFSWRIRKKFNVLLLSQRNQHLTHSNVNLISSFYYRLFTGCKEAKRHALITSWGSWESVSCRSGQNARCVQSMSLVHHRTTNTNRHAFTLEGF